MPTTDTARLDGIDLARWLLCFAVALLHSVPPTATLPVGTVLISIACRAAVPFFFVASGYFAKPGSFVDPIKRLAPVYVAWLLLYSVADHDVGQLLHPGTWLTGGNAIHLWFIPALMVTLMFVPNLVTRCGVIVAGLVCALPAAASLAFDAFRMILHWPVIGGTRLMMAPLLVFTGIVFRRTGFSPSPLAAAATFVLAWVAAVGEELAIAELSGQPIISHAAVAPTFLMGPTLFLWAKGLSRTPAWASRLGKVSLGVYAGHLFFVRFMITAVGNNGLVLQLVVGITAILEATALSLVLARVDATRWLVQLTHRRHGLQLQRSATGR